MEGLIRGMSRRRFLFMLARFDLSPLLDLDDRAFLRDGSLLALATRLLDCEDIVTVL